EIMSRICHAVPSLRVAMQALPSEPFGLVEVLKPKRFLLVVTYSYPRAHWSVFCTGSLIIYGFRTRTNSGMICANPPYSPDMQVLGYVKPVGDKVAFIP